MLALLLIAGFIAVLVRFTLANHRSVDRPGWRVWKQVILLAAYVIAGVMTFAGVRMFYRYLYV